MKTPWWSLVGVVVASSVAHGEPWYRGPHGNRRVVHVVMTAAAGGLYLSGELLKPDLAPTRCRWCEPPSIDASVRDALVWYDTQRAATLSNLTGFIAAPAFALGMSALGAYDDGTAAIVDDTLPVIEAIAFSEVALQVIKLAAARQRPFVHYGIVVPDPDDNLSFFSAHAALGFACATSAGMVAHRRHSPLEPYVWAGGMTLAVTTSYLRIAADKHYLSDVLAGSAFGVGAGLLTPWLVGREHELAVVPIGKGVALSGRF